MRFTAWYGMVVGFLVLVQWAVFLATGNVPQLDDAPREIAFHLAAEVLLAMVLLTGSVGLLRRCRWARIIYPVGLGMVLYSVVNSPGYFAQRSEWALVAMFMVLLLLSLAAIATLVRDGRRSPGE